LKQLINLSQADARFSAAAVLSSRRALPLPGSMAATPSPNRAKGKVVVKIK
jgi:hypothetical protein